MIDCRSQLLLCLFCALVCCGCPSNENIPPEPGDSESQVSPAETSPVVKANAAP
jgi:hypothetical protein